MTNARNADQLEQYQLVENPPSNKPKKRRLTQKTLTRRKFLIGSALAGGAGVAGISSVDLSKAIYQLINSAEQERRRFKSINHTWFVDFSPAKPTEGVTQDEYQNYDELAKFLLGEQSIPLPTKIIERLRCLLLGEDFEEHMLKTYPQASLILGALKIFKYHGEDVIGFHREFLNLYGFNTDGQILPVQSAIDSEQSNFKYQDSLGNQGVDLFVSGERMIALLQKHPDLPPIINFSFQMGRIKLVAPTHRYVSHFTPYDFFHYAGYAYAVDSNKYTVPNSEGMVQFNTPFNERNTAGYVKDTVHYPDPPYVIEKSTGKHVLVETLPSMTNEAYQQMVNELYIPIHKHIGVTKSFLTRTSGVDTEIIGSYQGEQGLDNFSELIKVANAFPNRLFVCAAGNYGDDLRPIRDQIEDGWPQNILIVGQWNSRWNSPLCHGHQVHGADLFVDNYVLLNNMIDGSSVSTAIISAVANLLYEFGIRDITAIKNTILECCKTTDYYEHPAIRYDEPYEYQVLTLEDTKLGTATYLDVEKILVLLLSLADKYRNKHVN